MQLNTIYIIILVLWSPFAMGQQYDITHYSQKEGVYYGDVLDGAQDDSGNLWFISNSGVIKHNGSDFKYYFPSVSDSTTFNSTFFFDIICDEWNRIWVITDYGLFLYNLEKDKFLKCPINLNLPGGTKIPQFTGIHAEKDFLIIGSFYGVFVYDVIEEEFEYFNIQYDIPFEMSHQSDLVIWNIIEDEYRSNHFILSGNGFIFLVKYERGGELTRVFKKRLDDCGSHCSYGAIKESWQQDTSKLWLASYGGGLIQYDIEEEKTLYQYKKTNQVISGEDFDILEDFALLDSNLLLLPSRYSSPALIDINQPENIVFLDSKDYPELTKRVIGKSENVMWLMGAHGITKYLKEPYEPYDIPHMDKENNIRSLYTNHYFYLKLGTQNPIRYSIDSNLTIVGLAENLNIDIIEKNNCNNLIHGIRRNKIYSYHEYPEKVDSIIIDLPDYNHVKFCEDKLMLFDDSTFYVYDIKKGILDYQVKLQDEIEDELYLNFNYLKVINKNICYLYNGLNIIRIDIENKDVYKIPLDISNSEISEVIEINGYLWIGKRHNGVLKLNLEDQRFESTILENYHIDVNDFYNDGDSILWFSELNSVYGYHLIEDKVIFKTLNPISMFFKSPLYSVKDKFYVKRVSDNIIIDKNHVFEKIRTFTHNKQYVIDSLISYSKENYFSFTENDIRFDFNCVFYGSPHNLILSTFLEGSDKEWKKEKYTSVKEYRNLAPGKYVFHAKLESLVNEISLAPYTIYISKPWYNQWWFILLLTFVLLGVIYYLHRLKVKREMRENRYLRKMAQLELNALKSQLNPHFIFNCLNSIKSLIQKNENKLASQYLIVFSGLVRKFLDFSSEKEISLQEELDLSENYLKLELLRFSNKFRYKIDIAPHINASFIFLPPLLLQPYIENAIWHGIMPMKSTKQGFISIKVNQIDGILKIEINDNGIGRDASYAQKDSEILLNHTSKGSDIIKQRARLNALYMDKSIEISILDHEIDDSIAGTQVTITINHNHHESHINR